MATRELGYSFQPGVNGNGQARNGSGPQAPRNPVQEAIQMLSLRYPKVFGARAIAPAPLLTSPGGMGQPAARGNVSAQALAILAGVPSGTGMPSMPAPMIPPPPLSSPPPMALSPAPSIPPPIFRVPDRTDPGRRGPEPIFEPPFSPQQTGEGPWQGTPLPPPWSDPRPTLPLPPSPPQIPHVGFQLPPAVPGGDEPVAGLPGPLPIFDGPRPIGTREDVTPVSPTPAPDPQGIQALADALFRKFPRGFDF